MKLENKQYLVYGGLAVIVGSIGYIVYSSIFVKKPIAKKEVGVFIEEEKITPSAPIKNPFKDMLDNPVIPSKIDWSGLGSGVLAKPTGI